MPHGSGDLLGFAQTLDQRTPQQESARALRVSRCAPQLLMVLLAHRGAFLGQHALVSHRFSLRVLSRHMAGLPLIAVRRVITRLLAQNFDSPVGPAEALMEAR